MAHGVMRLGVRIEPRVRDHAASAILPNAPLKASVCTEDPQTADHHGVRCADRTLLPGYLPAAGVQAIYSRQGALLLLESLNYSCPLLGAGSSSGVELFQVFIRTGLWQDGADQQVFHCLFIPTFTRCLSILVESQFLHKGFASSSHCPGAI